MSNSTIKARIFCQLERLLAKRVLNPTEPQCSVYVGYSGGLDSTVLLYLLTQFCLDKPQITLEAVHVNHQLSPHADSWERHCHMTCQQLGVRLWSQQVLLDTQQGKGVEAAARDARYGVFQEICGASGIMLLAQHQDDQAETVVLRLMRGSGPLGLSAMEPLSIHGDMAVGRPLLAESKAALEALAKDMPIGWIEDESNSSEVFDRNFLRHSILPRLDERWPSLNQRLERSARLCREAVSLTDELATEDLTTLLTSDGGMCVDRLNALSTLRCRNVLRFRLRELGLPLPSEVMLNRVLAEVLGAKTSAKPYVSWAGGEARRYRNRLYFMKTVPQRSVNVTEIMSLHSLTCDSAINAEAQQYYLPWGGVLRLANSPAGDGWNLPASEASFTQSFPLTLTPKQWGSLMIGLAKSKDTVQPQGRSVNPMKHWWQEYHVPFWYRDRQPLLYSEGCLVAVPGMFPCDRGASCQARAEAANSEYITRWVSWWLHSL